MIDLSPRLNVSIERMRNYYPAFSFSISEANRDAVWQGRVRPIQTYDGLEDLLDDIHHERPYYILPGGEIRHHPACTFSHERHDWFEKLSDPRSIYEIEVRYGGGRRHPKAFVVDPPLPENSKPHTFGDGAMCPYAPWHQAWLWEEHTVVDFMAHVLGWLVKWTVWTQTGTWIGPEMSHSSEFLLRKIGPNKQCWCGSGVKYKKCHRSHDEAKAYGRN